MNLTLTYPHKTIFKEASFTLTQGDKIGVLGLNGHGKSSFFKIIAEMITADTTVPPFIMDKNKEFSCFLVPQELPQHPQVTIENYVYEFYPEIKKIKLALDTIAEQLSDPDADFEKLINKQGQYFEQLGALGEDLITGQYLSYLKLFGITELDKTITHLSGGEQRKIALSLGLSANHKVILWDEPTNHLDFETIQLFEDELMSSRKTFLIISHDRSLLNNVADRIVHIQHGKINSFKGTYNEYLIFLSETELNRQKEIEKLSNVQRRETAWIQRGAKARRTKSKKRIEDYSSLNQSIQELKQMAHKKVSLNMASSGRKTKNLITAKNLGLQFGENSLFKNLDITINKGDKIALVGPNGAGKSSLLKLFMGDILPTQGEVARAQNLSVGFFSQKRESLDPETTPWKLIGEGIDFVISNTGEKRHVASYLENFLFSSEEIKRPIHTFSGGEKNRLQLAQFMKHSQDLWIFDEPTNDLDLETIGILEEELRSYEGALIVVGHDRTFIENVTDKCWLLHEGKLEMFDGGFSQAELFLEAIILENKLKKLAPEKKNNTTNESPNKLSYNQEKRLESLPTEIDQTETQIEKISSELEQQSAQNPPDLQKLSSLQTELSQSENKLAELYQEWETLSSLKT
jgi:ATP-binding cassette subfamily F protein uup